MVLLKISYRIRAHQVATFDQLFAEQVLPLIRAHRLPFRGIWRTVVGDAGEYLELWEFDSVADFGRRWGAFVRDPKLEAVFQSTGPLVENERLTLLEPVHRTRALAPGPADFAV